VTGVPAAVFVIGLLMEGYGLYFVLGPGSLVEGLLWIVAGLSIQVASGAHTKGRDAPMNPLRFLIEGIRAARRRVRLWDDKR
jgi:hypothetical protein